MNTLEQRIRDCMVTPFAGVWIEMNAVKEYTAFTSVTPFAGVWIEMYDPELLTNIPSSLPSRECGLKCVTHHPSSAWTFVTPFAGVWIEIYHLRKTTLKQPRHSLRGSVD